MLFIRITTKTMVFIESFPFYFEGLEEDFCNSFLVVRTFMWHKSPNFLEQQLRGTPVVQTCPSDLIGIHNKPIQGKNLFLWCNFNFFLFQFNAIEDEKNLQCKTNWDFVLHVDSDLWYNFDYFLFDSRFIDIRIRLDLV